MIEHVPKDAAEALLRECHRVLQPAACCGFRLLMPAATCGPMLAMRVLRHPAFPAPYETPLDRINHMMREDGQHLWVYDAESLLLLLRKAGFSVASEKKFAESADPRMQQIDSEGRAFESLYVEGVK